MSTLRVGYRTFGRTSLNYGLHLCLSAAARVPGIELQSVSAARAGACDVLLFSLFWWQHLYDYLAFLDRAGIDPRRTRRPLIVLGGFQSFNLRSLGRLYHFACLGDGEEFLPAALAALQSGGEDALAALPGCYWPGKVATTDYQSVAFHPYSMTEPGQNVTRLEIARGCRYRCAFCALAHLKPYREGDPEELRTMIGAAPTKRVALFAPDRLSYSDYGALQDQLVASGKVDAACDTRFDRLGDDSYGGGMLFGLEGVSERLRRAVGKPIPTAALVEKFSKLVHDSPTGKRGMRFFLILDLPGETDEDYEELTEMLRRLDETPEAPGMTLTPLANTFLPNPHTPLQWSAIHPFTNFRRRVEQAIWPYGFDVSHRWRLTIAWTPRIWGPASRVKSMLACRGDERAEKVLLNLTTNAKLRTQVARSGPPGAVALLRFCESAGIPESDLIGEWDLSKVLPWEGLDTRFAKGQLWKRWTAYWRIMGRDLSRPLHRMEGEG